MNSFFRTLQVVLLAVILFSCSNDMAVINKIINPEEEPDLAASNIEVLYSDSAQLQMKLKAPVMKQYSSAKEQRKEFPEGLRVWFYEKTGELKAEITADRAVHNEATNIWEATGNVMLINSEGQKLETEQLFWNAGKGTVYSEKYTKITQKNGTVSSGDSFRARQDLSGYTLGNRSGVGRTTIFLEDEENSENKP